MPLVKLTPVPNGTGKIEMKREFALPEDIKVKIGRSVKDKNVPKADNAIFDSKVLSRSHAEFWSKDGTVFIRDTKSSNGTYLNDERLSPSTTESDPCAVRNGDLLKLGVDVNDAAGNSTIRCVVLEVSIEGNSPGEGVTDDLGGVNLEVPLEVLLASGDSAVMEELTSLRADRVDNRAKLADAALEIANAVAKDRATQAQLAQLLETLETVEGLADERFQSLLHEDKLISRIDMLESQLKFYMERATRVGENSNGAEIALREELDAKCADKHEYEMTAKRVALRQAESREAEIRKSSLQQREIFDLKDLHTRNLEEKERAVEVLTASNAELAKTILTLKASNADLSASLDELKKASENSQEAWAIEHDSKMAAVVEQGAVELEAAIKSAKIAEDKANALQTEITVLQAQAAEEAVSSPQGDIPEQKDEALPVSGNSDGAALAAAAEALKTAELRAEAAESATAVATKELQDSVDSVVELSAELVSIKTQLKNKTGEVKNLQDIGAEMTSALETHKADAKAAAESLAHMKTQLTACELKLSMSEKNAHELIGARHQIEELEKARKAGDIALAEATAANRAANDAKDTHIAQMHMLTSKVATAQAKVKDAEGKIDLTHEILKGETEKLKASQKETLRLQQELNAARLSRFPSLTTGALLVAIMAVVLHFSYLFNLGRAF